MQAHLCSLLLCKGTDLDCSWDPWGPEEDTSSSQLKGVWATLSLLAPQSLFFICSYSVPQTDLSPSVSAKVPLSQLSFLLWPLRLIQLLKKLQKSQWPSTRHGDQGCLSLRRLFHRMCIWKRSSRSNFHAQERCRRAQLNETQSAGWRQDGVSAEGGSWWWWWRGRVCVVNQEALPSVGDL